MASFLDPIFARFRRTNPAPTSTVGTGGTAVYGGIVVSHEKTSKLIGRERYNTFGKLLANVSIAAAGVRYFLNLVADADWKVEASDPDDEKSVEMAEKVREIMDDMETPWHRVIRRAAMYRFYGFSVQEWTAERKEGGHYGYFDIEPRPQLTIERWDLDAKQRVQGMIQRSQQTAEEMYIPRAKTIYLVDDTLSDSPEGLGIFRHLVEPSERLQGLQNLEVIGYETDLRGVPVAHAPIAVLNQMVADGDLSDAERTQLLEPVNEFIKNHIRSRKSGVILDSSPYRGLDEAGTPSRILHWAVELMRGEGAGQALGEIASAIERIQREIARILGIEQLLLGGNDRGSFALSRDKTQSFLLLVNATLNEIAKAFEKDFLVPLWNLNGWDKKYMPTLKAENVQFRDISDIAAALRDMGQAGVIIGPDEPAVKELFDMMGLSRPTGTVTEMSLDQSSLDNRLRGLMEQRGQAPVKEAA